MLNLSFLQNYLIQSFGQDFDRFMLEGDFSGEKFQGNFFASESRHAESAKNAFVKYNFRFSNFIFLRNYCNEFFNQGLKRQFFTRKIIQ